MVRNRLVMPISGLSCGGGGALAIERAIGRRPGVTRVYVNPFTEMAYVDYDPARTGPDQFAVAVEHAGFRAGTPSAR